MPSRIARASLVALLAAAGLVVAPQAAPAQIRVFQALKGKVVAVSGAVVQWTDATNADMYVQLVEPTRIKVTGEAEVSFLQPGMYVRFPAKISKRGKIADDIEELTIFTPGDGYMVGLYEDGEVDPKEPENKYFVAGQIDSFKNGLYTIETGDDSFKIRLSDEVKINLETRDLSYVKADDEITITGGGENKTQILATEIEIKLTEPLAGEEKKTKRSKKSRRGSSDNSVERQPADNFDIQDPALVPDSNFD